MKDNLSNAAWQLAGGVCMFVIYAVSLVALSVAVLCGLWKGKV